MSEPEPHHNEIYEPAFVAELFDRCSANYRWWSAIASMGFVQIWRFQCVARLQGDMRDEPVIVDLMAGTGEVWPHLLRRFPKTRSITAYDISHRMHQEAVRRLHSDYAERISHFEADVLRTDLPAEVADMVVSTFGLKTLNQDQQRQLAKQLAQLLKPGGQFAMIEASDPKGWMLRPVFRLYLDRIMPLIERFFLKGAKDFSMVGIYTREFGDANHMAECLKEAGLEVSLRRHFFGCATSVAGKKR